MTKERHIHPEAISIYPGIEASYNSYSCEHIDIHHSAFKSIMEIHHCHYGRIGWKLNNNTSIYLGEGDVAMHSTALCSDSSIVFPLGSYEGISINIDFDILESKLPELLSEADIDVGRIKRNFCNTDKSITFTSDAVIEHIFSELYHKPEKHKNAYLKIKVIELLLYLDQCSSETEISIAYNSDIIRTIEEIHALMINDLSTRYTIDDLSNRFLINTSTLKEAFKAVYGQPIATYMKEYRIRHAAKLLKHTEAPLSEIAAQIGYGTQSKFTQAFKDCLGMLPSEYRKL